MIVRAPRLLLALLAALAAIAACSATAGAKPSGSPREAAAQRLAATYAPITMLREETDPPCEKTAEQYEPTTVDTVLGNPTVVLTHEEPDGGLADVKRAPTADDIAGLPDGYYLNLEGKVLGDTCIYARAFKKLLEEGRAPATTYAHIAREPNHSGFVLQYWFFWYFNQFNDLHEGDWEGMQISFESETTEEALGEEPSEIIVFQHSGGERADWGDSKVQKDGTHPIVYPAAGSHATFYDSAVYIQNGQHGSGVGCDVTTEPLRRLRPRPVLMPETASETGPFKWLTYDGRWGEREKGFNNGPTGPQTKTVWREPFAWMAKQRTTSPRLPGGSIAGNAITGVFCGAVAGASDLINLEAQSRPLAIGTIAAILLLLAILIWLTRWRPVDVTVLRAKRATGQLLRAARQLYGRHWRVLVPAAIAGLVIVGGTNVLSGLLAGSRAADSAAGRDGFTLALSEIIDAVARPVAGAIAAAIVIVYVRELERGRDAGLRQALRGVRERFWRVVGAQLLATFGVALLGLTVVGIPVAIYKLVGWAFVQQEVIFTDKSITDAFRGSSDIVRGRWWRAVRVVFLLTAITAIVPPALTLALIFTPLPLLTINLLGALIFALLIPFVAVAQTLLYFDLEERASTEGLKPRRSWRPWRPRQFGRVLPPDPRRVEPATSG